MDSTTFKPYTYDPQFFIDKQAAVGTALSATAAQHVSELPLSSFYNYTAAEENLNQITQQTGVSKFIGNQLIYISAGETTGSYTTGVLTTPDNPQRDLLNRYHPTVNFKANSKRHTREQLGDHVLPHRVAVLNYISVQPRFRVLSERLTPGETYIIADPSIYGSGQGNNNLLTRDLPIDHDENVTWIKSAPVYIGQTGRIINTRQQANFYNYTSTEQTLGAPKHGVSKFTDNFDFFADSVSGDVWANQDVYKLTEANKYDMVNRQRDLLTDKCDSPYRWRTDIYGNEYMLYKKGTQIPKRTVGGSDTDEDGRDDEIQPGQGQTDYYQQEIDQEGVFINTNTSITVGQDGLGFAPTDPQDETPPVEDTTATFAGDSTPQLPLADCEYFLYGGESLSPQNSATNLDLTYRFTTVNRAANQQYTVAGGVSAIIDGGWRSQHDQTSQGDQYTNQFEHTSATGLDGVVTGFFDRSNYFSTSASFDPDNDEIGWLPDWTKNTTDTRRFPTLLPSEDPDPSYTFVYSTEISTNKRFHDRSYVFTPPVNSRRAESDEDFPYVVADGGWYRADKSPYAGNTFFRTQCDRASYILATYGSTGTPDFGNHIFACKIHEITSNPDTYLPAAAFLYADDQKAYDADLIYAKQRGALNATTFRNPIEWSVGTNGSFGRNIQFFGTVEQLAEWQNSIANSGTSRAALSRLPLSAFDYLTLGEYYHMRISNIEGTGVDIRGEKAFFDDDLSTNGTPGLDNNRYLGTPDIFYYVSGGTISYQGGVAEYTELSASVSYIHSLIEEKEDIQLYDIGTIAATQFPQTRHDVVYNRVYNVSVQEYNTSTCNNVSEYRVYSQDKVVDGIEYSGTPDIDRMVKTTHPVSAYHGQTFKSKRGYFPPPVGHLRRTQTFPVASNPSLIGPDEPIPHNLLPQSSTDGVSGFYVHDVWDGAGFIFQAGADATSTTQLKDAGETSKEPGLGDDNLAPIDYIPNTDTVVPIDGDLVANLGCGGYTGYFNSNTTAPNPYLEGKTAPLGDLAQIVKRASDNIADMCYVTETPTLWKQKHTVEQIATAEPTNAVIRNLYSDNIMSILEAMEPLVESFADGELLSPDRGLIDMDVVNDTLVLRQQDSSGNRETYVFDQINFDYKTGSLKLGERATHHITTQPDPRSSVLCHYFNEDDNCLIVGYTHFESTTLIYPVLYKLDLNTHQWSEIYSGESDTLHFQISTANFGGVNCDIITVDPGEISYNPATNNYSITYFANVSVVSQPDNVSMVIFNHMFENRTDHLQLVSANMFHSQNKTQPVAYQNIASDTAALDLTEGGVRNAGSPEQLPISFSTSSDRYDLTLDLTRLRGTIDNLTSSTRPVQLHVDWGDGETTTIYSDFDASIRRYGPANTRVKVGENTTLKTPASYDTVDTSLVYHKLIHSYHFSQPGTTTATVNCYMNDQTTTYNNQVIINHVSPDISSTFSSVKLLNTKLYSSINTSKQHLLMTLETQSPRHVSHNIIDIDT